MAMINIDVYIKDFNVIDVSEKNYDGNKFVQVKAVVGGNKYYDYFTLGKNSRIPDKKKYDVVKARYNDDKFGRRLRVFF